MSKSIMNSKVFLTQEIPVIFPNKFPAGFVNDIAGWNFSQDRLKETTLEGLPKLLTLDIDFGLRCSLNCPHCFRRSANLNEMAQEAMTYEETIALLREAKKLGLESIKFLGAGEPFENEKFLDFLMDLKKLNIVPCIFTKGHVIGDDKLVEKYYSQHGITTGEQLVEKLYELNVSILLGFNSFDDSVQNKMVAKDGVCGVENYTEKRNRALKLLVEAGFNKTNPTRLAFIAAPITPDNIRDIFDIYQWGRRRNICVVSTPTMVSGRGAEQKKSQDEYYGKEKFEQELIDLYTKIYVWNIENEIMNLDRLQAEGVSAYAGVHPCNQASCGMYVTLKGKVIRCPGRDDKESTFCDDIRHASLKGVWLASENCKRAGTFNNHCPAKDGRTIPARLYTEVMDNVRNHFCGSKKSKSCNFERSI